MPENLPVPPCLAYGLCLRRKTEIDIGFWTELELETEKTDRSICFEQTELESPRTEDREPSIGERHRLSWGIHRQRWHANKEIVNPII